MKAIQNFHNDINSEKYKDRNKIFTKEDFKDLHYELMRDLDIDFDTFSKLFIHMRFNNIYFAKYTLSTANKLIKQSKNNIVNDCIIINDMD